MTSTILIVTVASYFLGAIPFGYLIAKANGIDIFKVGSGSTGATNVSRVLGKKWGLTVFALDVIKGIVPTWVARGVIHDPVGPLHAQAVWFLCGLAAVIGHCISPFLGFRGGKGIATALGVGLAASPEAALGAFGVFLIVFAIFRYVSLASMIAVLAAVVLCAALPGQAPELIPLYSLVLVFVVYRHRANIRRLREGTEPKFAFKKKSEEDTSSDRTS